MKDRLVVVAAFFAVAVFALGLLLYPSLPERVASHWNLYGQVDGYSSKLFMLLLMPALSAGVIALYYLLPRIDPLASSVKASKAQMELIFSSLSLFLTYVQLLTVANSAGIAVNVTQAMLPGMAALFFVIGTALEKTERNWFVGIRTPWTLSSERVWRKTHELGGKAFKACAVVMLLAILLGPMGFLAAIAVLLASAFGLVVYSYLEYRKERH